MTEEFLHYLWKNGLFDRNHLHTACGQNVRIINLGLHNLDSGPDFFNAKIQIGETIWAGNVEIHKKSSDWFRHNHSDDKAYDNVILHVVFESDSIVTNPDDKIIPELSLKGRFDEHLFLNYQNFLVNQLWVPCQNLINSVDPFITNSWLNRVLFQKLEKKVNSINQLLENNKNDWNGVFYRSLARNFGFNLNSDIFENLANSLSLHILMKHRGDLFQIEALLFGQSGLLNGNETDEYPRELFTEYTFLRHKYSLNPLDGHLWKFMRMRPNGFPTLRISQFAKLINDSEHVFSKILVLNDLEKIRTYFEVKASGYWNNHFVFDSETKESSPKKLGYDSINLLLINTIIPFVFAYGEINKQQKYKDRAVDFLTKLKPDENSIIKKWRKFGIDADSAFYSQALIELKHNFCEKKNCLNCVIGNFLLKRNLK